MLTEACQHASGRAFCLSTRCIKKHPLLHCDVSRPLNYVGACSLRPCRHGAPRRLPLTQFVTNARPRAAQPPASRSTSLRVASSWALLLGTPPGHSSWAATWAPTWIQTRTMPQDRGQGATRGDSNWRRAAKSGALCSRHLGIRQPGRKRLAEVPPSSRTVHACDWPESPSCETVPSGPEIAHRKPCWATPTSLPLPLPLPPCLPASLLSRRQEGQPQAPAPRPRTRVLRIGARTGR